MSAPTVKVAIESAMRKLSERDSFRHTEYDSPSISRRQLDEALRTASEFQPSWEKACSDYRVKRCEGMREALKHPKATDEAQEVAL